MKISVSTLAFYPQPLVDILASLEDKGVKYCEIINEYPYDYIKRDIIDSYNLEITVHAPLSDINPASHIQAVRKSAVSQIKNSMDIASKIDSEVVVVHPGYIPILGDRFEDKILEINQNSLKECSRYAQDVGVKMCLENMPDIDGLLGKDLEELEKLVLDIDSCITLDVGHAHNLHFTVEEMLKSPRIKHIHLSDNDGSFDKHKALGSAEITGNKGVDFPALFKRLKKMNYRDVLVVEVRSPPDMEESLDYLKKELGMI
jgi:sugar phosphate isomerase/epimerase